MHLPSSYADPPYDPLRETVDQSNIDGKDELKERLHDFKQRRDDIIKAERQKLGRGYANKTGQTYVQQTKKLSLKSVPFFEKTLKKDVTKMSNITLMYNSDCFERISLNH